MRSFQLIITLFFFLIFQNLFSQNYLRINDPDIWNGPTSNIPGWHESYPHGQLEEVSIIAEPQGIYTEIGFYATISQGPDAWSWNDEFEIIWQFSLPPHTIVHDSWLWVEQDIIKADVVDYWTALATYEEIVNWNEDPSFFYQLPDNRYEIRIYPLFEGESRRIKMSFLVPTQWDLETTTSELLQNILQSTDYSSETVGIGMPVDQTWQSPKIKFDNSLIPMSELVTGGSGELMHYIEIPGEEFVAADDIKLVVDAPLSDGNTFVSTYTEGGEKYYQLAFVPDWQSVTQNDPKKSLLLIDYNPFKTSLNLSSFHNHLQFILGQHFNEIDQINVAVMTDQGIKLLNSGWWDFDPDLFSNELNSLLNAQNEIDLEQLLLQGYNWAQGQGDVSRIYLLTANDDYVYPPYADEVFSNIQNSLIPNIPFTLIDYQDENISIIYHNNIEYQGNEYFYQLLNNSILDSENYIFAESEETYMEFFAQPFPSLGSPSGILDYTTTLENGITYHRYSLTETEYDTENGGAILQTGKYLGDFPMNIHANLVTSDGQFWNISTTVNQNDIVLGDTLMKEMWYGPHLRRLETLVETEEDRLDIIDQSIQERVLTSLTAFLALEPSQGGEPCINCLFNNGAIVSTDEFFEPSDAELVISPNPAIDFAKIQFAYKGDLNAEEWTATVYNATGKAIRHLDLHSETANFLEWEWKIDQEIGAGIYFCKIRSIYGELIGKIVVLPK